MTAIKYIPAAHTINPLLSPTCPYIIITPLSKEGIEMISVYVMLGCIGCFIAGFIAGSDYGAKETLSQLDKQIDF